MTKRRFGRLEKAGSSVSDVGEKAYRTEPNNTLNTPILQPNQKTALQKTSHGFQLSSVVPKRTQQVNS